MCSCVCVCVCICYSENTAFHFVRQKPAIYVFISFAFYTLHIIHLFLPIQVGRIFFCLVSSLLNGRFSSSQIVSVTCTHSEKTQNTLHTSLSFAARCFVCSVHSRYNCYSVRKYAKISFVVWLGHNTQIKTLT